MNDDLARLCVAEAARLAPSLGELIPTPRVESNVTRWIGDLERRREAPGGGVSLIRFADERGAIAEQLEARDGRDEHWVRVHAIDAPRWEPETVSRVDSAIRRAFPEAPITGWAFYEPGPAAVVLDRLGDIVVPYKRYLAARIGWLRDLEPDPRVRCAVASSLDFYPQYAEQYREFHASSPELRDRVRIEPREAMQSYLEDGGIGLIEIDGQFGGVVCAARECELGLSGWCIHERVIFEAYRGRGLGAAIMVPFARALDGDDTMLLWGHIAPQNVASTRTALEIGRRDIGGLFWVPAG